MPKENENESPFSDYVTDSHVNGAVVAEHGGGEVEKNPTKPSSGGGLVGDDAGTKPAVPPKEGDEEAEDSSGETKDNADEAEAAKEESPPKPKKSVQERIAELTRARHDESRRADGLARELTELRAGKAPEKKELTAGTELATDVDKGRPLPSDSKYKYGELDSQYIADVVKFETRLALAADKAEQIKERQQEAAAQETRELKASYDAQIAKGLEKFGDFQTVVIDSKWPLSETLGKLLLKSDVGAEIAYHLASNPKEAGEVYGKTPLEQAAYFGRQEARFSAPAANTEVKVSKAPAPIKYPRGTGGKLSVSPDTSDFEAFAAMADATIKRA